MAVDCAGRGGQVSVVNPRVIVHACKLKVDGITKYLDNQAFQFDHVRAASVSACEPRLWLSCQACTREGAVASSLCTPPPADFWRNG